MPYLDKTKIMHGIYHVFIAKRTGETTPVTLPIQSVITAGGDATWKPVGAYKEGAAKHKSEDHSISLQNGAKMQMGVTGTFEVPALETDATKLTTLETFINESVDILCVRPSDFNYVEYKGYGLVVGSDDKLQAKDADEFPLKATGTGAKLSDLRAVGVLAVS